LNERGNVSQVLNIILAILLLIALAITVYAISEARSLQSEAKKPTTVPGQAKKTAPTLALNPSDTAKVGETVTISGTGYPKDTSVFVIVRNESGNKNLPSLLDKSDSSGAVQFTAAYNEAGLYKFSSCYRLRKGGGSWDCKSIVPVYLQIQ
jgi:hypothetical protein